MKTEAKGQSVGNGQSYGNGSSISNGNVVPFYLRFNWELAALVRPSSYSFWTEQA